MAKFILGENRTGDCYPFRRVKPHPVANQEKGSTNAKAQFSQNDRIDRELPLVGSEPRDHALVRDGFGRFAENVGIRQVNHKLFVDSESIVAKYPFSGHANSQSTMPWFGRA